MLAENYWDTFFDPPRILKTLGLDRAEGAVVDVGAGYARSSSPRAALRSPCPRAEDIDLIIEARRGCRLTWVVFRHPRHCLPKLGASNLMLPCGLCIDPCQPLPIWQRDEQSILSQCASMAGGGQPAF